jgi:hypothetical protein
MSPEVRGQTTRGDAFGDAAKAILHYLPETGGWGWTVAARPPLLWNPQVQTSHASFGGQTNGFGFTITGHGDRIVVVGAGTDLFKSTWYPLQTNNSGSFYFSDPQWTNYPNRFYRLRMP